jgi:hypothetical protein
VSAVATRNPAELESRLEAHRIREVPLAQVDPCFMCGREPLGDDGPRFVAWDTGGQHEAIPAGCIETVDRQPGGDVYRARTVQDGYARNHSTVIISHPMMCSGCILRAAKILGFDDTLPLLARTTSASPKRFNSS